ncbi:MAG: protein-methionine-sulfoxide reductase catalytic subunit MsrP [Nitrospinaceae bacterium]
MNKKIKNENRPQPFAIRHNPPWSLDENRVTPKDIYVDRRNFLKGMGKVSLAALAFSASSKLWWANPLWAKTETPSSLKASPENLVGRFNNFYEFTPDKSRVWKLAKQLPLEGWSIQVKGLVKQPQVLQVADLIQKFDSQERIYRLRCVETWSAVIPWRGFPLRKLIQLCEPLSSARYVKFKTFLIPNNAPGQKDRFWEPWPYVEGLTLAEAMHDLSFLATGMYGHPLNPQNGAPIRLVVPWKYGFKSIKSIVAIEFTREAPRTFWQDMSPLEYDFEANVLPKVPYARWHQSVETLLGENQTIATLPYNGYADQVASLYK